MNVTLEASFESLGSEVFGRISVYVYMCVDVYTYQICIWRHSSVGLHMFGIKVHRSIHELTCV